MKSLFHAFVMLLGFISSATAQDETNMNESRIIIAHRGASGYVPEHTLPAKTLAHEMGADYIEQDVVLSRDGIPVVLHDIYLDAISNVASAFPGRAREDGRYYVIDFDLAELKSLHLNERINLQTGQVRYAGRPARKVEHLHVATLAEEIAVIQGLNKSSGRNAGLYVEIKSPAWHRQQGRDISTIVLAVLAKHGYSSRDDSIYLQCFDPEELQRIRSELGSDLKLVQLIGDDAGFDYANMRTPAGLAAIALYADAIGPSIDHVLALDGGNGLHASALVEDAHKHGLKVHAYTARKDALPSYVNDFDELMEWLFVRAGVDGVFTDFPDLAIQFRDKQ